jgi:hypothetical protein
MNRTKLFGWEIPGTDKRYVQCPACGTGDYRTGMILESEGGRSYQEHCRACGAHLGGDRSRDYAAWHQWDALFPFYFMNAFAWAAIWFFPLAIPISLIWDFPTRQDALTGAALWGAAWGLARAYRAYNRGEMFCKKPGNVTAR